MITDYILMHWVLSDYTEYFLIADFILMHWVLSDYTEYFLISSLRLNFWFPVNSGVRILHKRGSIVWMKYSVDPDQLASLEASWSVSTLFAESFKGSLH